MDEELKYILIGFGFFFLLCYLAGVFSIKNNYNYYPDYLEQQNCDHKGCY